MKKVLLVDDNPYTIEDLYSLLEKTEDYSVYRTECGREALYLFEKEKPDIIVLDITLPDMDGYEVCKRIRKNSMVPIIFLTGRKRESDLLMAYSSGGDEYLKKPFNVKEVLCRMQAMLDREDYYLKRKKIRVGEFQLCQENNSVIKDGKMIELSEKEYQLLKLLTDHQNRMITRKQIMKTIWGDDDDSYDNTLTVHMHNLRKKIEDVPSKPVHILTVKKMGYMFV